MRREVWKSGNTEVAVAIFDNPTQVDHSAVIRLTERLHRDFCAVLLRGLHIDSADKFSELLTCSPEPLLDYRHGNSPRSAVTSGVYTSTEYPAEYNITLHNEMSYAATWPDRLFFCCLVPAQAGGETPVCDASQVLRALSEPVRERFTSTGLLYQQNLHDGVGPGKSWQQTYDTRDPAELESYLRAEDVGFEWLPDGTLRTYQRRPATRQHPRRLFDVWFNQAEQWHPSCLPPSEAQALRDIVDSDDELPLSVTFGDGSPIPESDLAEVRRVAEANAVDIRWERGDVLVVDNVAAMHGRRAYSGDRRVLVAMS
jgi:alpha-ketoglutarate-dependent taurine dioxygenase